MSQTSEDSSLSKRSTAASAETSQNTSSQALKLLMEEDSSNSSDSKSEDTTARLETDDQEEVSEDAKLENIINEPSTSKESFERSSNDSPSSDNAHKCIQKKHSEIMRSSLDFFPLISDDSSKSRDSHAESREELSEASTQQIHSARKRKLSVIREAMEDADSELSSSNDDSNKEIKKRKTLQKCSNERSAIAASAETSKTTSQNSQTLTEEDSSNPISLSLISGSLLSVNVSRDTSSDIDQSGPSAGTSNDTLDQVPTLQISNTIKKVKNIEGMENEVRYSGNSSTTSQESTSQNTTVSSETNVLEEILEYANRATIIGYLLSTDDSFELSSSDLSTEGSFTNIGSLKSTSSDTSGRLPTLETPSTDDQLTTDDSSQLSSSDSSTEGSIRTRGSSTSASSQTLGRLPTLAIQSTIKIAKENTDSKKNELYSSNPGSSQTLSQEVVAFKRSAFERSSNDSPSSDNTHNEDAGPSKQKKHLEIMQAISDLLLLTSDDSSKSGDSRAESRKEISVASNQQIHSAQKRKLGVIREAMEDADSERSSSNDDSDKEIKKRKKLQKCTHERSGITETTTSQNSQILTKEDSLNPISLSLISGALLPVNNASRETSDIDHRGPSAGTSNNAFDQVVPTLQISSSSEDFSLTKRNTAASAETTQNTTSQNLQLLLEEDSSISFDSKSEDSSTEGSLISEGSSTVASIDTLNHPLPTLPIPCTIKKVKGDTDNKEKKIYAGNPCLPITTSQEEATKTQRLIARPETDDQEEVSDDAKLENIINELSTSEESIGRSSDSKLEDSITEDALKSDLSKSKSNSSTDTAVEQSSEDAESDSSEKGSSNQDCHFQKKLSTIYEDKLNSNNDSPSSGNTQKEHAGSSMQKKHSEIIRSSSDFLPLTSDDPLKSGDSRAESRNKSSEDNTQQIRSALKRKLSDIREAVEDADSERSSSNDDSDKETKKRKKLQKCTNERNSSSEEA